MERRPARWHHTRDGHCDRHPEYARLLREAGFSDRQAEGQAHALAAMMTDSLATKQDLGVLDGRLDGLERRFDGIEKQLEIRFGEQEKRFEIRFVEQEKRLEIRLGELEKRTEIRFAELSHRFDGRLADLERRMTMRLGGIMVAGIATFFAIIKVL